MKTCNLCLQNPELEARIQKLKAEQENEQYKKMIKGLDCSEKRKVPLKNEGLYIFYFNL